MTLKGKLLCEHARQALASEEKVASQHHTRRSFLLTLLLAALGSVFAFFGRSLPDAKTVLCSEAQADLVTTLLVIGTICLGLALYYLHGTLSMRLPGIKAPTLELLKAARRLEATAKTLAEDERTIYQFTMGAAAEMHEQNGQAAEHIQAGTAMALLGVFFLLAGFAFYGVMLG